MAATKGYTAADHYAAVQQYGTAAEAARALGLNPRTVGRGAERHEASLADRDPGVQAAMTAAGTDLVPRQFWVKTKPTDDEPGYSVMLAPPPVDPEDIAERLKAALEDVEPAPVIPAPESVSSGCVAFLPTQDWHLGATISEPEGGAYNRDIAIERLKAGFAQCNAAIPPSEVAIVLHNGDTTHANDDRDATPKSGHKLKVQGSHQSNLFAAETVIDWQIQTALTRHGRVEFAIKRGNHDPNTPAPIIMAMRARYRNEPRVTVIEDESPFYQFGMGKLFLVAHHGDGIPVKEMAQHIPHKFRREWGAADHHFLFTAHRHHSRADTFGGLHWRQLPAVCGLDQHAHQIGYADTSGMYSAWFDTQSGQMSEFSFRF